MPGVSSQFKGDLFITTRGDQSGGDLTVAGSLTVGGVDFAEKADKVAGATNGHLATLDASGNLTDSGKTTSDFAAADHVHAITAINGAGSAAALNAGTGSGEVIILDANGRIASSVLPIGIIWVTNTSGASTMATATLADHNRYIFTSNDIIRLTLNVESLSGEAVVSFETSSTVPAISGLDVATMSGDDCVNGNFTPRNDRNYTIRFYGDSVRVIGTVLAVERCVPESISGDTPTITPANGKRFNCGTLTTLTIEAPVSFNAGDRCQVYFKSNADGTMFTNSSGAIFSGSNVSDGSFSPSGATEYLITMTKSSIADDIKAVVTPANRENLLPVVIISAPTGTEISISNGTITFTGTSENGVCAFTLPVFGRWTISGVFDDWNADGNVYLDAEEAKTYTAMLTFADLVVFGARHYKTLSSSILERLGDAAGKSFLPQIVTETITGGVSSYEIEQNGVSGFDNAKIYRDIKLCNVVNGAPIAYYGDAGFSFVPVSGDVCVEIPKFYVRIDQTPTTTTFWISNKKGVGFSTSPAHMDRGDGRGERDKVYLGRYSSNADYRSISGSTPKTNTSISQFRTGHTGRGNDYYNEDYLTLMTILILYTVETADLNSQSAVGTGHNTFTYQILQSGKTDAIGYHSGKIYEAESPEETGAVHYRWIENLWGNTSHLIDGVITDNLKLKVFTDPSQYTNMATSSECRILSFNRFSGDGFVKFMHNDEVYTWALFPSAIGSSSTSYFCDYVNYGAGTRCVTHGYMNAGNSAYSGFFKLDAFLYTTGTADYIGSRIIVLP